MTKPSETLCLNCKWRRATIFCDKARWCRDCNELLEALSKSSFDRGRRAKTRDIDYRNRNAPGGAWDHSER